MMTQPPKDPRPEQWFIAIFHLNLILAALCLLAPVHASAQNWGAPVWADEFSGAQLSPIDSTKWNFDHSSLNVNNELEWYCGPVGDPNNAAPCDPSHPNVYIDGNGHLVIQANRISSTNAVGSWTSARMNTSGTKQFQYGRIEASEKLPVGAGLWPAFWALGSNFTGNPFGNTPVAWPGCGEMEFMENVPASGGLGPTIISSTIHGPGYSGGNGLGQKFTFPASDPNGTDVTSFHTYGAIWSPNMVQFYVDDPSNVFFIRTASDVLGGPAQWVFNHGFIAITNLAVGGGFPGNPDATTPSPAQMLVDYVRVYQASAMPPPNLGNSAAITVKAGAATGNTSTIDLSAVSGSGRVFLACTTTAPLSTCSINTGYALNANVVDFTSSSMGTASVTVATTASSMLPPIVFDLRVKFWAPIALAMLLILALAHVKRRSRGAAPQWSTGVALAGLVLTGTLIASCGGASVVCGGCGTCGMACPNRLGTPPGVYNVTVNAYTVTGNGTTPDTSVNISLTVN